MAYPTYFPQYYPNPYIPLQQMPQIQQPIYQPQVSGSAQQAVSPKTENTQPQVQSGGFVPVPSEEVARNYPVANGVSVTFKDENAPYVYTKTKGFSQLDVPVFERYRLVKEEDAPVSASEPISEPKSDYATNDAIEEINSKISQIKDDIDDIRKDIDLLKDQPKRVVARKKDDET